MFRFAGWVNLILLAGVQGAQTALLGPLKEVLESMTGGYEVMKEVVAALQDTERGKTASMTVLLQELQERQASKPSREEQERLRLEVRHRSCCQSVCFSELHSAYINCIGLRPRGAADGCHSLWWIAGCHWLEQNNMQHSRIEQPVLSNLRYFHESHAHSTFILG